MPRAPKVLVTSEDESTVMDVVTDEEEWTEAKCRECKEVITDRGNFEDTVEAARLHIAIKH